MEDRNLTAEDRLKIIAETISANGFFGLIERINEICNNNSKESIEEIKPIEQSYPKEELHFAEEPINMNNQNYDIERPSIYRDTAIDLVNEDNMQSTQPSYGNSKSRVLTNPAIHANPKQDVGSSIFADAQIVSPGTNIIEENHQVL